MATQSRWMVAACIAAAMWFAGVPPQLRAQQESEISRKVKIKVPPQYPAVARRMNIGGRVRLMVVVAPNGSVKKMKVMGGHPLLISAAEDAIRKWKFEPAGDESSGVVEFDFKPDN